jgi:type IV pilus assembly protein PilY1
VKRYLFLLSGLIFLSMSPLYGDDTDLFTVRVEPNVLILMDNSASMNEVIYHGSYDPQTTYPGDGTYKSGSIYWFNDTSYKTIEYTANGVTAKLYWGPGDEGTGVRYNGNYLNWIYWFATEDQRNNLPQRTRMQVAREVLTDIVNNTIGVRFGLMKFNSEHGGTVVADCGAVKDTILDAINGMLATTWTPLSETMVEAWSYFTGTTAENKSYYSDKEYTSPIAEWCQENSIIIITDGEPTKDWTFPDWVLTAIDGHYDKTSESGNGNNPYYLDGVAWYLNNNDASSDLNGLQNVSTYIIGFNISHPLLERSALSGGGAYSTANNAEQLTDSLKKMLKDIDERTYLFTSPTVPANRINESTDNVTYIATFRPSEDPFWEGNIKAYQLDAGGTLPVDENGNPARSSLLWDAHEELRKISPASRKIYTYRQGSQKEFTSENISKEDLGVDTDDERNALINHIRGIDAYDTNKNGKTDEKRSSTENIWILGDIFHSNPVIVGEPSRFFEDECFNFCSDGSESFYNANKNREKIILVGANDGMLHAFNANTGIEEWAFIPNSVLSNLKAMISDHTYYVDSSPKVADVWFGDGNGNGKKDLSEWRTVLVCGLRKGGKHHFALDITDTLNPKYLWEFPSPNKNYNFDNIVGKLGESWSEPAIGRVKITEENELREKWVAFIGGGLDSTRASGKAFFVIDIKTGDIIKEFSGLFKMNHCLAAPPTAVDKNANGYVDRVYIGDLGGQMWVFDVSSEDISKWTGNRLFVSPGEPVERHPIYYQPAVAFDKRQTPWVFFGTGDRENPTDKKSMERFYAVKDDGPPYPREEEHLEDVTSNNTLVPSAKKGWYIKLEKSEKVLAKSAVFNKLLYFTTYTYTSEDVCKAAGNATLYVVEYLSGGGALVLDDYLQGKPSGRSESIGEGVPSAPVISVNLRGKASASITIGTTSGEILTRKGHSPSTSKEILYWREVTR